MISFKNKIIFITGGSSGIGKSTALLFAENGADIAFTFKNNEKGAQNVTDEIKSRGRKALAIQVDLCSEEEVKLAVEKVVREYGRIDVLVNNAGRYIDGDEWNGSPDTWIKSLEQNLVSMMSISKYVIGEFQKQKNGVMVNVASRHGVDGHSDALSYSAAKAGVINITQSYAELLKPFGRANSVSPSAANAGYWLTAPKEELEQVLSNRPNHKLVEPETVANKIVFLASDEAKDITGQNFQITE